MAIPMAPSTRPSKSQPRSRPARMNNVKPSSPDPGHAPVMLEPVLAAMALEPGDSALDCTAGRGGHAEAIARTVGQAGRLILCDLDPENLDFAASRAREAGSCEIRTLSGSFARAPRDLRREDLRVHAVFADLGVASTQIDRPERGFSFHSDGPLDMRMDPSSPISAADLVATSSESELTRIIGEFGEEPYAGRIARKIVRFRDDSPIHTTAELAGLVREAYGSRAASSRNHPATRTFQALRIAVNDELGALDGLLRQIEEAAKAIAGNRSTWLEPGARVAFLTFHSLEDRLVKRAFATLARRGLGTVAARTPMTPSESEIATNPRSRSAKLRVATVGDPS